MAQDREQLLLAGFLPKRLTFNLLFEYRDRLISRTFTGSNGCLHPREHDLECGRATDSSAALCLYCEKMDLLLVLKEDGEEQRDNPRH
jgi:hypothetical protein